MTQVTKYFIIEDDETIADALVSYGDFSDGHDSLEQAKKDLTSYNWARLVKLTIEEVH